MSEQNTVPDTVCEHCGALHSAHYMIQFVPICPTAVFQAAPKDTTAAEDLAKRRARRVKDEGE